MLDIRFVRENQELVEEAVKNRNSKWDMAAFSELDAKRRDLIQEVETLKAERNSTSKEIGAMMKAGH